MFASAPGRHFNEHAIEEGRDFYTGVTATFVETDTKAGGIAVGNDGSIIGFEAIGGIFGGDTALDGVAFATNIFLFINTNGGVGQGDALRYLNLGTNNIDACNFFGDGMFHLNAWIDFDEENIFVFID